jgi:DNA-binding NarL/FixJ family response regulator
MVRLLVAEDHAGVRDKVISTLETEFSVVGSVGDGQEMLDAESRIKPDVVILDISMPTVNGIEAATRLKQRGSKARVIFLTVHEEPEFLQAALAAGALGYVIKSRLVSDLRLAVREVMAGRRFVSPPLTLELCEEGCIEIEKCD